MPRRNGTSLAPVRNFARGSMPKKDVASGGQIVNELRGDDQSLYDRQLFEAGTVLDELLFFNLGFDPGTGATRTWVDTNMPEANRLPGEFTFSVRGIAVYIFQPVANDDLFNLQLGLFVLQKNDSRRFQERVVACGGGGGVSGVGQGAANPPILQNGSASPNDYRFLKSFIPYQAEDRIEARIEFTGALAQQTLTADTVIEVRLRGAKAGLVDRV